MNNEMPEKEFEFVRDKLKGIASCLCRGNAGDLVEASFMVGCLHSICHQNSIDFRSKHKQEHPDVHS